MGYSHSVKAIVKAEAYLKVLVNADNNKLDTITFDSKEARALAYRLHNALASAEFLSYAPYNTLRSKFTVNWNGGKVTVKRKDVSEVDSTLSFDTARDAFAVVQTIIAHKELDFELLFPEAELNELILNYCEANGYTAEARDRGFSIKRSV